MVTARVEEARLDRAMDVLEQHGAVDLDEREATWKGTVKLLAFGQASWQAEGDAGTEFKPREQPR